MSTLLKTAVEALNERLEELTPNATPEQLAYLSKSVQNMAGQGTILDIVALTDDKLQELLDAATAHLSNMSDAEASALGQVNTAKTDALDDINTTKINAAADLVADRDQYLGDMETSKNLHLGDITAEGTSQLAAVSTAAADFIGVNDVPSGSTIMTEVNAVQGDLDAINDLPDGQTILTALSGTGGNLRFHEDSLPFLFGVLSRYQAYNYGPGEWTSELGQWYTNNEDWPFNLLTGAHGQSTAYAGFMRPPSLQFLEGDNGRFNYKRQFQSYANSSNIYQYPAAVLGILFVKNTTGSSMDRTFYFGGSSYWSSGYEGASLNVATPNDTNTNKDSISAISWNTLYSYSSSSHDFGGQSVTVTIPADTTIAIMLYTTPQYLASPSSQYASFMGWYIYNFRSNFMTDGLEIDFARTIKAWQQGNGASDGYQIWN